MLLDTAVTTGPYPAKTTQCLMSIYSVRCNEIWETYTVHNTSVAALLNTLFIRSESLSRDHHVFIALKCMMYISLTDQELGVWSLEFGSFFIYPSLNRVNLLDYQCALG